VEKKRRFSCIRVCKKLGLAIAPFYLQIKQSYGGEKATGAEDRKSLSSLKSAMLGLRSDTALVFD